MFHRHSQALQGSIRDAIVAHIQPVYNGRMEGEGEGEGEWRGRGGGCVDERHLEVCVAREVNPC